eukprot:4863112-Pyramimonas_sp.AAC.1
MPDRAECDEFGADLLPEDPSLPLPSLAVIVADGYFSDRGFMVVAGDEASPGQASDLRFRRSGYALCCGPGHAMNISMPLTSVAQCAQSSE